MCLHDRAIFCSTKYASGNPTLGAMLSPMADHICVESSVSNFPLLYLNYQVNSNFCLFGVNVLGSRCSLFSRFSLFDFPGLCFKVETDKILFTAKHHRLVFGLFWVHLQPVARKKKEKKEKKDPHPSPPILVDWPNEHRSGTLPRAAPRPRRGSRLARATWNI